MIAALCAASAGAVNSPLSLTAPVPCTVNVAGVTSPRSISFHVHGAETVAPRRARTVYTAANVAWNPFLPVST